jgi:hypothetical protein
MLDDDRLASLFTDAAATFDVPASGSADILARAMGRGAADDTANEGESTHDDDTAADALVGEPVPHGRVRRLVHATGRHRVLSAAAVIVVLLVVAGVVGTQVRGPAQPTRTAAPSVSPATRPAPASTTTTTPAFSSSGSAHANASAPLSTGTSSSAPGTQNKGTQNQRTQSTGTPNLPNGAVGQPAKIEQTGSLTLTVGHGKLSRTVTQLTALAGTYGGFVANSQTQSGAATGGAPSGSVTLQVPVQSFATLLQHAEALGRTSDLTTKATDVSSQYVDLQARITALEASRQQYLTILAKATTVGDVLAVQEQIDSIQSQIEQLQGQLQLLTSQTSYSSLTVTIGEHAPAPSPGPLPESGLVRAWHASIGGFLTGVEGVIRLAGPVVFALLLLGVVLAGGRALWRRYQRRHL